MKHDIHILTELKELHVWHFLTSIEINRKYQTKQEKNRLIQIPASRIKRLFYLPISLQQVIWNNTSKRDLNFPYIGSTLKIFGLWNGVEKRQSSPVLFTVVKEKSQLIENTSSVARNWMKNLHSSLEREKCRIKLKKHT